MQAMHLLVRTPALSMFGHAGPARCLLRLEMVLCWITGHMWWTCKSGVWLDEWQNRLRQGGRNRIFSQTICTKCKWFAKKKKNVSSCRRRVGPEQAIPRTFCEYVLFSNPHLPDRTMNASDFGWGAIGKSTEIWKESWFDYTMCMSAVFIWYVCVTAHCLDCSPTNRWVTG